jgi:hypothetical protein
VRLVKENAMTKEKYLETLKNAKQELQTLIDWVEADAADGMHMERPEGATEIVEAVWEAHIDAGVPDETDFPNG